MATNPRSKGLVQGMASGLVLDTHAAAKIAVNAGLIAVGAAIGGPVGSVIAAGIPALAVELACCIRRGEVQTAESLAESAIAAALAGKAAGKSDPENVHAIFEAVSRAHVEQPNEDKLYLCATIRAGSPNGDTVSMDELWLASWIKRTELSDLLAWQECLKLQFGDEEVTMKPIGIHIGARYPYQMDPWRAVRAVRNLHPWVPEHIFFLDPPSPFWDALSGDTQIAGETGKLEIAGGPQSYRSNLVPRGLAASLHNAFVRKFQIIEHKKKEFEATVQAFGPARKP